MVQAMQRMDSRNYWQWLNKLELNNAPDTDLPGAVSGQLKSLDTFTANAIEPATASFGQGLALTPLKLLQLHGMLSNGGRLVSPTSPAACAAAPSYPAPVASADANCWIQP